MWMNASLMGPAISPQKCRQNKTIPWVNLTTLEADDLSESQI